MCFFCWSWYTCGFSIGVMWLAALLGFPCWLFFSAWQAVREALLFLLSYWWS